MRYIRIAKGDQDRRGASSAYSSQQGRTSSEDFEHHAPWWRKSFHFSAAKIFGITHVDDQTLVVPSEKDILLMIQGGDVFVKNENNLAPIQANVYDRYVRMLVDEPHFYHAEQGEEQFLTLALFPEIKTQRCSNLPLDFFHFCRFHASVQLQRKGWVKKLENKVWGAKRRSLSKVDRHVRPMESSSSNQRAVRENQMKNTPWEKLARW